MKFLSLITILLLACSSLGQIDVEDLKKVDTISPKTIENMVFMSRLPWIIAFSGANSDYEEVAKKHEGIVKFGVVESDDEESLELLEVSKDALPKFRAYMYTDSSEEKPAQNFEDLDEAIEAVRNSYPEELTTIITDPAQIQQTIMSSLEEEKLTCIIYTAKEGVPDLVLKLAVWMQDQFTFAIYPNPDPQVMSQSGVEKLPEIHILAPQLVDGTQLQFGSIRFDRKQFGGVRFTNVLKFLMAVQHQLDQQGILDQVFGMLGGGERRKERSEQDRPKTKSRKTSNEPAPLFEITAETPDFCTDAKLGLCVIGFIDASPANPEKDNHIAFLEQARASPISQGSPLHYMWVDVSCHPQFAEAFGISLDLAPTIVAVSPRKQKYARLLGGFEAKSITDFVSGVLSGKNRFSPYSDMPTISEDDDCEAAHAAMTPIEEEEIDLDDIMAEILEDEAKQKAELEESVVDLQDDKDEQQEKIRKAQAEMERLNAKSKKRRRRRRRRRRNAKKDEL